MYTTYNAREIRGIGLVDNARVVVIVALLLAVLLSAFAAERLRVCHGERRCVVESTPGLLPAARFFMTRAESRARAGQTQPQTQTHIQVEPRPAAATMPDLDPTVIPADTRRDEAEALAQPSP
ncbi:hypothetical protein MXD81_56690 [Microbacteriaceae bacterium K1510]|nr:hypothetical protein [Microbacteriaceae bacterium K1510]